MSIFCANVIAESLQGVFYLANQGYQRQLFPCRVKRGRVGKSNCVSGKVSHGDRPSG